MFWVKLYFFFQCLPILIVIGLFSFIGILLLICKICEFFATNNLKRKKKEK